MCGERCQEAKDFHRHILRGLSETFLDGSKTHNTFTLGFFLKTALHMVTKKKARFL